MDRKESLVSPLSARLPLRQSSLAYNSTGDWIESSSGLNLHRGESLRSPVSPLNPTTPYLANSPSAASSPTTVTHSPTFGSAKLPVRLIVCVDGSRCSSDAYDTLSNVHRIYAGIKRGICADRNGEYNQIPQYITGLGSATDTFSSMQSALSGQGHLKQIQDVYESCCKLTGEQDEVVFFGFSRGAYVVRAVVNLLHQYGVLVSAGHRTFAGDFEKLMKKMDKPNSRMRPSPPPGRAPSISSVSTVDSGDFRLPPRIRFVGVFDTIGGIGKTFDVSFNDSVQHLRHAVCLHEDRKALIAEHMYPEELHVGDLRSQGRSFVQAHFVGGHGDMGGVSQKNGLSLYPLQWMVVEARLCGVEIATNADLGGRRENSLSAVFPKSDKNGSHAGKWTFRTRNGVVTTMHDVRHVHDHAGFDDRYKLKLNTRQGSIRSKKPRAPFDAGGELRGYCHNAPQGTIVHPSVYLLLDEHISLALDTKEARLQRQLEEWRELMLGVNKSGMPNFGFWGGGDSVADSIDTGPVRVLVCGNTGVGKSTLINKTFGVDVTQSSDRKRGIHDVKQEITFEGRPDLVLHDSGGFEAGAETEFIAIEEFLKAKSQVIEVQDRLHVIWFCIEINSARTLQTATEKLFQAVSRYAKDVPIVIVATKKDDLIDLAFSSHRKGLKKAGLPFDEEACDRAAEAHLEERLSTIRQELESIPGGRLDALVAVSQDDDESVAALSKTTSHCFDIDKVRMLYIRAQVTRIDLKIDVALCEVMQRYKALIRTATGTPFSVPGVASAHRQMAANKVCHTIMNSFGLPMVGATVVIDAMKQNVWNHIGFDMLLAIGEGVSAVGIGSSAATMVPAFLITGAISLPLIVPATCRLFLTMACDLILVLVRSFKEVAFRDSGQPGEKDVTAAARNYRIRGYSERVHSDIKKLIPRRSLAASYKCEKVRIGVEAIVERYKDELVGDADLPVSTNVRRAIGEDSDDNDWTEDGSTLLGELSDSQTKAIELEAWTPVSELSSIPDAVELYGDEKRHQTYEMEASAPAYELDATVGMVELEAKGSLAKVHELSG